MTQVSHYIKHIPTPLQICLTDPLSVWYLQVNVVARVARVAKVNEDGEAPQVGLHAVTVDSLLHYILHIY